MMNQSSDSSRLPKVNLFRFDVTINDYIEFGAVQCIIDPVGSVSSERGNWPCVRCMQPKQNLSRQEGVSQIRQNSSTADETVSSFYIKQDNLEKGGGQLFLQGDGFVQISDPQEQVWSLAFDAQDAAEEFGAHYAVAMYGVRKQQPPAVQTVLCDVSFGAKTGNDDVEEDDEEVEVPLEIDDARLVACRYESWLVRYDAHGGTDHRLGAKILDAAPEADATGPKNKKSTHIFVPGDFSSQNNSDGGKKTSSSSFSRGFETCVSGMKIGGKRYVITPAPPVQPQQPLSAGTAGQGGSSRPRGASVRKGPDVPIAGRPRAYLCFLVEITGISAPKIRNVTQRLNLEEPTGKTMSSLSTTTEPIANDSSSTNLLPWYRMSATKNKSSQQQESGAPSQSASSEKKSVTWYNRQVTKSSSSAGPYLPSTATVATAGGGRQRASSMKRTVFAFESVDYDRLQKVNKQDNLQNRWVARAETLSTSYTLFSAITTMMIAATNMRVQAPESVREKLGETNINILTNIMAMGCLPYFALLALKWNNHFAQRVYYKYLQRGALIDFPLSDYSTWLTKFETMIFLVYSVLYMIFSFVVIGLLQSTFGNVLIFVNSFAVGVGLYWFAQQTIESQFVSLSGYVETFPDQEGEYQNIDSISLNGAAKQLVNMALVEAPGPSYTGFMRNAYFKLGKASEGKQWAFLLAMILMILVLAGLGVLYVMALGRLSADTRWTERINPCIQVCMRTQSNNGSFVLMDPARCEYCLCGCLSRLREELEFSVCQANLDTKGVCTSNVACTADCSAILF